MLISANLTSTAVCVRYVYGIMSNVTLSESVVYFSPTDWQCSCGFFIGLQYFVGYDEEPKRSVEGPLPERARDCCICVQIRPLPYIPCESLDDHGVRFRRGDMNTLQFNQKA